MQKKNRNGWKFLSIVCSSILCYGFCAEVHAEQLNRAPRIAEEYLNESGEPEAVTGSSFCMDLTELFTDEDGEELTFYAKLEGQAYRRVERHFQFLAEAGKTTQIILKASDGTAESEEYRVIFPQGQSSVAAVSFETEAKTLGEQPQELEVQWANFRNSAYNMAITDVKTPRSEDASAVSAKWIRDYKTGNSYPSVPIIVEDSLVIMSGTTLYKLDKDTGEVLQKAAMAAAPNFGVVPPVYGAGMIFCPLNNGTIQAFDAKTLEPLWIYHDPLGGQSLSPVTYADGYLYTGFWNAEWENANFVCIRVADENTGKTDEEKEAVWSYTHKGGFYWAGSVVVGQAVIVGSDDGSKEGYNGSARLYSFDKTSGAVISELSLASDSGDQRSSIAYDPASGKVYFTTKGGYLYSAKADPQTGMLSELKGQKYEGAATSTPVVYKNRVYFGTGQGFQSGAVIAADAETLQEIYRVELKGYPQSSLLLSTAYEASTGYLYFYTTYNNYPGGISAIKATADAASQLDVQLTELYTPADGYDQYCITSLICDKTGTLYYKNDTGNLFAVGIPDYENVIDLINAIGAVTLESEGKITTAREAYDALDSAQKRNVTNYSVLVQAEKELEDKKRQKQYEEWMEWLKTFLANFPKTENTQTTEATVKETSSATTNNQNGSSKNHIVKTTTSTVSGQSEKTTANKVKSLVFKDLLDDVTANTGYEEAYQLLMTWNTLSEKEQLAFENSEEILLLQEIVAEKHHQDADTGICITDVPWNVSIQVSEPQNEAVKEEISEKFTDGTILKLWDIYLEDCLTEDAYEPEAPVGIQLPVRLLEAYDSYDSLKILHYKDDRSVEILNCEISGGYLTFHAVDFSYYAVVGMEGDSTQEVTAKTDETLEIEEKGFSWLLWAALAGIGIGAFEILVYLSMKTTEEERKQAQEDAETDE